MVLLQSLFEEVELEAKLGFKFRAATLEFHKFLREKEKKGQLSRRKSEFWDLSSQEAAKVKKWIKEKYDLRF